MLPSGHYSVFAYYSFYSKCRQLTLKKQLNKMLLHNTDPRPIPDLKLHALLLQLDDSRRDKNKQFSVVFVFQLISEQQSQQRDF